MREWIQRSWFRHPLSLRPFFYVITWSKGVGLGLTVISMWDEGWHAHTPLDIQIRILRWSIHFGIKDSN